MIRVYCLFIKNHPEKENEIAVAKLLEAASQAGLVEANARKPWGESGMEKAEGTAERRPMTWGPFGVEHVQLS
jgi:hypothetical protein